MIGIGLALAFTVHARSNDSEFTQRPHGPYSTTFKFEENVLQNRAIPVSDEELAHYRKLSYVPKPKAVVAQSSKGYNPCSCVSYARYKSGLSFPSIGMAKNLVPNTETPQVGGIVITYESGYGHLAVITAIEGSDIVLSESNYSTCKQTEGRRLNINSSIIKGYFN